MKMFLGKTCVLMAALLGAVWAQAGDFSGLYIGANLGGSHNDSNAQTSTVFSSSGYFATSSVPAIAATGIQNPTANGFAGGGQAGYNLQRHRIVLGVEADFGAMNLSASSTGTATYPCCPTTGFTITQSMSTSWLFTVRPRVGFALGRLLVYGTGGMAVTDVNYKALFTDTFATAAENGGVNANQTGWIAGGGAEVKLSHRWSLKGEMLHADFGSMTNTSTNLTAFTPPISYPTNVFTHSADLTSNIFRTGLNLHF